MVKRLKSSKKGKSGSTSNANKAFGLYETPGPLTRCERSTTNLPSMRVSKNNFGMKLNKGKNASMVTIKGSNESLGDSYGRSVEQLRQANESLKSTHYML